MRPDHDLLSPDLLDAEPGPAQPLGPDAAARLVRAAVAEVHAPPRRRPAWLWVAAAAVVLVGVPAGAALYRAARAPAPPPPAAPAPRPQAAVEPAPEAPAPELAPEAQTLEPPAPEPPPRRAPRPRVRPSAPPPALIVPATPSADALLDEASRLRGQGRWAEAEVAYQRLIDAHPAHRAAYVARISAASLDLDHLARSARARDRYQAALTQGGPLDAEARWGLARAHRALGDAGAEVEALQALLQHHPKSAHAARARQRLEALAP